MDNNYITCEASLAMSSDISTKIGFSLFDAYIDVGRQANEFDSTLNLDLREEMRSFDDVGVALNAITPTMSVAPWNAVINHFMTEVFNLLMLLDRRNFLVHSISNGALYDIAMRALGKEGKLNFINNYHLCIYEKFIRGNYGPHSTVPYSVYSVFDLGASLPEEEKFTLIMVNGIDVIGEHGLIQSLVDSLAPGGTLVLTHNNHSRFLYSSTYFTDTYYSMHQVLLGSDGITLHSNSGCGITTFKKNG